ncbi:MAG: hypothetical protein IT347_00090 [Candidatus Eisenbacteria bacterium]|nr:hypothetical protein [Candidatus Eisenbacteria bacterium]
MAEHLTAFLYESNGALWSGPDQLVSVSPGHVVLDEEGGVVSLLAFEALGEPAVRCAVAVVAPGREARGPDALDDQNFLRTAAAAYGMWFARPGAAPAAALHRRRFAAPGAVLASSAPGAAGAGAFGMLALPTTPLECAAALAGRPLARPRPRVLGVHVTGSLPPGTGGAEALARLAIALGRDARDVVLEYFGEGLAALPMTERIAMASLAPRRLGVLASVFPCDDATRGHLAAQGREADWRRFADAGVGFDRTVELDLGSAAAATSVQEIVARIGPLAEDDDLRSLADALAGTALTAGARVQVVTGGRAARAALEADGTLGRLERAGVVLLDSGDPEASTPLPEGALACADEDALAGGAVATSVAALVARWAAPAQRIARTVAVPGSAALDPAELLAPPDEPPPVEHGAAHRVPSPLPPLSGGLRGEVLASAAGRVACGELLPWGPRVRALRGDARALAESWGRGLDPDAASHGLAAGGGFAVAAGEYGTGEPSEEAARATAALGVRAVIAGSFAPAHARALVLCGVVPLRWMRASDVANVAKGDELELPTLGELLEAGPRVTVRHLTRGLSFGVVHDLDSDALALVRAGGLLARARATGRT